MLKHSLTAFCIVQSKFSSFFFLRQHRCKHSPKTPAANEMLRLLLRNRPNAQRFVVSSLAKSTYITRSHQESLPNALSNTDNTAFNVIDLRSDTKSLPTDAMKQAMISCAIGDDVEDEDATTNQLQSKMSEIFGKEESLFVVSGTMSNLVSLMSHCDKEAFSEIIVGNNSHIYLYEAGNVSTIANIHCCPLQTNSDGTMDLKEIEENIKISNDFHCTRTKVICLEQSHANCGGKLLSKQYIDAVCELAHSNNIKVHLDGARLFDAATALGYNLDSIHKLTENIDSISVCFSKGLCCPVGSVIIGTSKFIQTCKMYRKAIGGGMRQSGVLASCCLVSLDEIVPKLNETHQLCKYFYQSLLNLNFSGICVVGNAEPQTNILFFKIDPNGGFPMSLHEFADKLKQKGILIQVWHDYLFRMVFYYGVSRNDVDRVLHWFMIILAEQQKKYANCV